MAVYQIFAPEYWMFWAVAMAIALFVPVRSLVWMMMVNRAARKSGKGVGEDERQRLRRRAGFTSALLCYIFSMLYAYAMFRGSP